jgi:hypothetical protein
MLMFHDFIKNLSMQKSALQKKNPRQQEWGAVGTCIIRNITKQKQNQIS